MNKKILLAAILALGAVTAQAQVKLKLTDIRALSELTGPATRSAEGDGKVDMILNISSSDVLDEVLRNGAEIVSQVTTGSAIVRVEPARVATIAGLKGIRGAGLPRLLKLANDQARVFSRVEEVLSGTGLNSAYDGTGVVVGLFDVGLDPNHINFRDKLGDSRVKLWLRYSGSSSTPRIYDTPEDIATVTTESPTESHGTHVAGIITGSYNTSLSDKSGRDFSGIAPGAEIVMAGGPGYNVQILDAAQRIAEYAKAQGKPCVINLSFGDNIGPHDGTDAFTKALNDVAKEYDAVICVSAGNERKDNIAIIKELTEEDTVLATLAKKGPEKPGSFTTSYYQTSGNIEIYTTDATPFDVSLDIVDSRDPENVLYSFPIPENQSAFTESNGYTDKLYYYIGYRPDKLTTDDPDFKKYYDSGTMGGMRGISTENRRYMADLYLFLNAYHETVGYNYVRITVKGKPGQKIFMYADGYTMALGNLSNPSVWDGPDGNGTNSNMGSGPETICVGSYVSNNVTGSGYPAGTVGDVSYFSSYGETPDGRIMPDVCAPGQVIISSRNTYYKGNYYPAQHSVTETDPISNTTKTYTWTSCAGTSQSSPHMAGIAALWRQANPNLTYKEIQEIARATAAEPGFNSKGWGYGRADALAGIKKILSESSVYDIIENAPESIMIESAGGNVYDIFAGGETSVSAAVLNLQGVKTMERSVEGDSLTFDLSSLTPGIYLMQVTTPHSSRTIKLRR